MKKKLEAELISIAHRVLKNHNREDIAQLQKEALNLYEKLSVLRFYEAHFEPAKPTIGRIELEAAIENNTPIFAEENELPQTQTAFETAPLAARSDAKQEYKTVFITPENELEQENQQAEFNTTFEEKVENQAPENDLIVDATAQAPDLENNKMVLEDTGIIDAEADIDLMETSDLEPLQANTNDATVELNDLAVEETFNEQPDPVETEQTEFVENGVATDSLPVDQQETVVEKANPLFSEQQPTLIDELQNKHAEPTLFSDNLFTEIEDENKTKEVNNSIQTSFVNLFGQGYNELEFVKAEKDEDKAPKKQNKKTKQTDENDETNLFGAKIVSDLYTNTITLGLNDRIAFQMHLFNNSDQDLNRVISQLNTMNNLNEALDFITNMVKPDYNNWQHKQEFEERFMALVEKRFS